MRRASDAAGTPPIAISNSRRPIRLRASRPRWRASQESCATGFREAGSISNLSSWNIGRTSRKGAALELAQGPHFPAPEWVDAGHAVLDPPDVQEPVLEVDVIPAQRAQLGDAQAVPVGDPDHGGIA